MSYFSLTFLFVLIYTKIWTSLVAQLLRMCLQCGRSRFDLWVGKIPWRRKWQPTPVFWPGNYMDRGVWRATVLGITSVRHTEWFNISRYTHMQIRYSLFFSMVENDNIKIISKIRISSVPDVIILFCFFSFDIFEVDNN